MLQLTANFRLPQTVLRLEQALIRLLEENYPKTLDSLEHEVAFVPGLPPLYFQETVFDEVLSYFGNVLSEEQAVLVRDAKTVDTLREMKIGGHVLTIEEAKGIDFDDVIIYNFFSSGTAVDKALEALNASLESREDAAKALFPEMHRTQTVCEELKLLNVAITRARQRVFFFEAAVPRGAWPFFRSHGVKQHEVPEDNPEPLRRESTAEGWRRKGVQCVREQKWDIAAQCFGHSGDFRREALCCSRVLRDQLRSARDAKLAPEEERRRRLRLAILHAEAGELQRGLDILKESSLRELKAWAGELERAASRKADS